MDSKFSLLPGEKVIMSSDGDILTLTTRRVRYDSSENGISSLISITLDSVSSCGLITTANPILLILGAFIAIGGIFLRGSFQGTAFVIGGVFIVAYFLTRKAVISIASNGGEKILAPSKGMSRNSIIEFLDAIEREKLIRMDTRN